MHYMTFPDSTDSTPALLMLRVYLVQWSQRTGIAHDLQLDKELGLIVTLPKLQHYTQFALQWNHGEFHIHKSKKICKKISKPLKSV
jgi:hypothetical protein